MTKATDVYDSSGNAFHGTATDLSNGSNSPPFGSIFHFGVTNQTLYQLVIPSNGSEPTNGVIGLGARSKLIASPTLANGSRFITTQGFGSTSTVIEPSVRDVYLYGNHAVPIHPFSNAIGQAIVAHAIDIDGDAPQVSGNQIFDWKGTAIRASNSVSELSPQRRVGLVSDNFISHCFTGVESNAADLRISNNTIANVRDYGIRDLAGSCQFSGNHCFGALTAISFENGSSTSTNDKFSDARTGFNIAATSPFSEVTQGRSIHCWERNMHIQATDTSIHGGHIEVANTATDSPGIDFDGAGSLPTKIVGIHSVAERFLIHDAFIHLGNYTFPWAQTGARASVGIVLANNHSTIRDVRLEGSSQENEYGIFILPDVQNLDIKVTTGGGNSDFDGTDSAIVYFADDASPTWAGTVDIIYDNYDFDAGPGIDIPVRIPANWPATLTIRTRPSTSDDWTILTPGTAYPQ